MNRQQLRVSAAQKLNADRRKTISEDARKNDAYLVDTTEFIAAKLTGSGSGVIALTKSSGDKAVGIQSFDGNKLDDAQHFVIDSVALDYGLEVTTDNKEVANANYVDAAPAELLSADLIIKQGKELIRIPVSEAHNLATGTSNDDNFRTVSHLPVIEANKVFEVAIEFAEGTSLSAGTDDHFVKVSLRGHKLQK
jgi:hypothetical protein